MDAMSIGFAQRAPGPRVLKLLSDDRLARRIGGGDREAFAEVFRRYHAPLYRYCRSLLRSEEDAHDALQNTMAAAMRALEGETREISLRPWLYRIAHNEAISIARRLRTHVELTDTMGMPERSAEDEVIAREGRAQLVGDLAELPERQRATLLMRELAGLPHAEIAAALRITPAAAKQAIYEARTMLHELAEGRAMACAEVRRLISDGDGRVLRGRSVRAHLSACDGCATFREAIGSRTADLHALAPPLAPLAAAAMLQGILGGGGGAVAGGATSVGVAGAAAAGAGKAAAGSVAAKLAVLGTVAAIGVGGVAATGPLRADRSDPADKVHTVTKGRQQPSVAPAPRNPSGGPSAGSRTLDGRTAGATRGNGARSHRSAQPGKAHGTAGQAGSREAGRDHALQQRARARRNARRSREKRERAAKARAQSPSAGMETSAAHAKRGLATPGNSQARSRGRSH
jgi:RNA polymerase sigma factor (sigma-70 family)